MTNKEKMKFIVGKIDGMCWHEGVHPLYKSACKLCGQEFTDSDQWPVNPSPTSLDDLVELARKLKFSFNLDANYSWPLVKVKVFNGRQINEHSNLLSNEPIPEWEALLNALYKACGGEND